MTMRHALVFLVVPATVMCISCSSGDGGPGPPDTTPPTIASVSPADGADDAGLIERVEITFSEAMDPSTINDETITVAGRAPRGHVGYDAASRTAYVVPETLYVAEAAYEIVVSDSITDAAGNALASSNTTSFETGDLDCEHLEDYFEPNGAIGEAATIETDVTYPTLAVCGDDDDYYKFTLTEAATVTAKTSIKYGPRTSWGMYFLRLDGEDYATLGIGAVTGGEPSFHFSFNPGTYALQLFGHDEPVYVLYDLVLETSPPCNDDEYEDNDFLDEARSITLGHNPGLRGCYLDEDFYTFDVNAGQTVTVTATQDDQGQRFHSRLKIYGPGDGYVSQDADSVVHTIQLTVTETGTCTIMARFWEDVVYDLDIDIEG